MRSINAGTIQTTSGIDLSGFSAGELVGSVISRSSREPLGGVYMARQYAFEAASKAALPLVKASVLGAMLLGACSRAPERPLKPPTVAEIISGCTPFYSAYGNQRLTFTTALNKPLTIWFRRHPVVRLEDDAGKEIAEAPYAVDELQDTAAISVGNVTGRFRVLSYGLGQCALIAGSPETANIKASWFGSWPDDSDNGDDDYDPS
jgi:hypothetical protein